MDVVSVFLRIFGKPCCSLACTKIGAGSQFDFKCMGNGESSQFCMGWDLSDVSMMIGIVELRTKIALGSVGNLGWSRACAVISDLLYDCCTLCAIAHQTIKLQVGKAAVLFASALVLFCR